jgi:SAM-dependent methyltransferase
MRGTRTILCMTAPFSCREAPADRPSDAATKAPSAQAPIDEGTVKAMSHGLLDAHDRADVETFAGVLGPTFTLFDDRRLHDRDSALTEVRARHDRQAPSRSRTYGEEHVSLGDNSAVFIGETVEHYPLDGARPTGDFDGWSTLVWVRKGGAWKAAYWQWVKAGPDADRDTWNTTYREGRDFNPKPSEFLMGMVTGRKPGLALDVAMGQGRNAVYLASAGWRVTGIDISDEGLRQARDAAAARKVHLEAINADADTWDYGVEKWDLVALIYVGCDAKMVEKLRTSLKRGGLVISERFHKDAVPAVGVRTGELAERSRDSSSESARPASARRTRMLPRPPGTPSSRVQSRAPFCSAPCAPRRTTRCPRPG